MSFQMASIFWRLALALARFSAVRLSRSARRHMLTSCFALLHMPRDFQRKPRAWHSSRAVMTSSHAVVHEVPLESCVFGLEMAGSIRTGRRQ